MTKPAKSRRWFRFSLRTLLVLLTIFCIWLGWNAERVHRRKATRAALEMLGVQIDDERGQYSYIDGKLTVGADFNPADIFPPSASYPRVSFVRRWLGDQAIWGITFPPKCPRELLERFDRDFPETPPTSRAY